MCSGKKEGIRPDLIEANSTIRGAIPVLPLILACICFCLNVFIPGSGTVLSGFLVLFCCCGRTRFSETCNGDDRYVAFIINLIIGLSQFCTIIFCLVGWCWSIGWGITMISIAKNNSVCVETRDEESSPSEKPIKNKLQRSASSII
nr:protein stum-like [Lepeophtheirus salmonis]